MLEDIKVNSTTLDQVKLIGEQLLVEATTEERLKIGKKLHSLEARFYGLEKSTNARMKDLQVRCSLIFILPDLFSFQRMHRLRLHHRFSLHCEMYIFYF